MAEKYLMFSMEDSKIESLAKVLGNKTCKKILEFLAETKEASENDIAKALDIPLNTVEYNLKTLLEVNLIEKTKNFFWSQKGKKIPMYKVSNKSIVISPKSSSKFKSIVPVALISLAGAFIIRQIFSISDKVSKSAVDLVERSSDAIITAPSVAGSSGVASSAPEVAAKIAESIPINTGVSNSINLIPASNVWLWFLFGASFALVAYLIFNWRKMQ